MSLHDHGEVKPESVADAVTDLKLDPDRPFQDLDEKSSTKILLKGSVVSTTREIQQGSLNEQEIKIKTQSQSPIKQAFEDGATETKAGDGITVKMEPGQPPKLARSSTKVSAPPPQLFYHLPNSTAEAKATFDVMKICTYANKYMGYTEHGMECDCAEEWGKFLEPFSHRFYVSQHGTCYPFSSPFF
jgi:[histone H3]-lysine36 N-trimethyltransferase